MKNKAVSVDAEIQARVQSAAGLAGLPLFETLGPMLCDPELAQRWVATHALAIAHGGLSLPAGHSDPVLQSVVMLDDGRVQLSLAIVSADGWRHQRANSAGQRQVVGFADGWTRICFLSAGDVAIQLFTLDGGANGTQAIAHPPRQVAAGDTIDLANMRQAIRLSHLGQDAVMLRLLVRDPAQAQAAEYDAETGEVLRVRQAQSHEGRTQMIVSLLRSLGRDDAIPIIADQIDSWPPHLRWHGVREALAIDSRAGITMLSAMAAEDPDAGLRSLAARTCDDLVARYPVLVQAA